jgi:hypothetical protein
MSTSEEIYHYTDINGLIGILTKQEIWASDCQLLNDGTELKYARNLFNKEVAKLGLKPELGEAYVLPGPTLDRLRVFVACFCEKGDLLSQWRGYGMNQGYSIGFYTKQLQSIKLWETKPVQYGIEKPEDYFSEELESATHLTAHPGVRESYASEELLPRLVRVKHPSFKEECEWRLFRQMHLYEIADMGSTIKYRPSNMGPIPYIAIPFKPEFLKEIIIGPGSQTGTRESAIQNMLQYLNLANVDVRISQIPYRK